MTITKEGVLASFYTVNKAPIKHLKVYFSPKQAGEGTPSPSNVREISGWSGLTTWYTNRNLFPSTDYSYYESGITVSRTAGKISITGTSNSNYYRTVTGSWTADGSSVVLYNVPVLTNGAYWYVWNGSSNIISGSNINGIPFQPVSGKKINLALSIDYKNITMNVEFTPIMCKTSDLSTIPIDWSNDVGTVYGGYVDLVTGELVQEYASVNLTGDAIVSSWVDDDTERNTIGFYRSSWSNISYLMPIYDQGIYDYCQTGAVYRQDTSYVARFLFNSDKSLNRFEIRLPKEILEDYSTYSAAVQSAKNYLNEHPLQAVYKIAPITHTLTPTQLSTLIGRNNIWSNADRVEVEYDLAESNDELYRRRNILLRSAPHIETASGNPVIFSTDMQKPLKGLMIPFSPIQEGTGDSSPTNVRVINGFDSVSITRCGYNLLNPDTFVEGKAIIANGTIGAYTSSKYSDLIPVNNVSYVFSGVNTDSSSRVTRVHGYDSKGNWIKQLAYQEKSAGSNWSILFTPTEDVKYIRISTLKTLANGQIEFSSIATSYVPYSGTTIPISFPALGKNLLDPATLEQGGIISSDGTEYAASNRIRSGYIPVEAGKKYTLSATGFVGFIHFYSANKGNIGGNEGMTNIAAPEGAAFARCGLRKANNIDIVPSDVTEAMLEQSSSATAYESFTNTCYGGELDLVNGVLKVKQKCIDIGDLSFTKDPDGYFQTTSSETSINDAIHYSTDMNPNMFCTQYKPVKLVSVVNNNATIGMYYYSSGNRNILRIRDDNYANSTASEFKTAMSGVKAIYELTTPITYQLTPEQITSLIGINNIWSNANGPVEIKYWTH